MWTRIIGIILVCVMLGAVAILQQGDASATSTQKQMYNPSKTESALKELSIN